MKIKKTRILLDDDGTRLDRWFKRYYPQYAFAMIAKLLRTGQIRLEGRRVDVSTRVLYGQEIRFPIMNIYTTQNKNTENCSHQSKQDTQKLKVLAKKLAENILYMDNNIIALNKPTGLAVQGGNKISISIDNIAKFWQFDAKHRPRLVHRLDKDTSGILILARTLQAAQYLAVKFKQHDIIKTYLGIVHGVPKPLTGTIDIPLEKHNKENGHERVTASRNTTRRAITIYNVIDCIDHTAALVRFNLITGRTHQIRVHCTEIGHPILGDKKYGLFDDESYLKCIKYNQLYENRALHLHALCIEAELLGRKLKITAPLPQHFMSTMNALGLTITK